MRNIVSGYIFRVINSNEIIDNLFLLGKRFKLFYTTSNEGNNVIIESIS